MAFPEVVLCVKTKYIDCLGPDKTMLIARVAGGGAETLRKKHILC